MQELTTYEIDTHNIVVNQLLFPGKGRTGLVALLEMLPLNSYTISSESNCQHCNVRHAMQQKYLKEAHELYDDFFHIVTLPLLTEEVRGPEKLREFSKMLIEPYEAPV